MPYTHNTALESREKMCDWKCSNLFGFEMHLHTPTPHTPHGTLTGPQGAEVLDFDLFGLAGGCVSPSLRCQAGALGGQAAPASGRAPHRGAGSSDGSAGLAAGPAGTLTLPAGTRAATSLYRNGNGGKPTSWEETP